MNIEIDPNVHDLYSVKDPIETIGSIELNTHNRYVLAIHGIPTCFLQEDLEKLTRLIQRLNKNQEEKERKNKLAFVTEGLDKISIFRGNVKIGEAVNVQSVINPGWHFKTIDSQVNKDELNKIYSHLEAISK